MIAIALIGKGGCDYLLQRNFLQFLLTQPLSLESITAVLID